MTNRNEKKDVEVTVDTSAVDLLNEPVLLETKEVEPVKVIFVPFKDFEARVNQSTFQFRKDVPTMITRDLAADLLYGKRGYVKD